MISDHLSRFQADICPEGALQIEGFWQRIAQETPEDSPVVGPLEQKLSSSYASLTEADQKALAFPGFVELAQKFQTEPFTAIAGLLEALREVQAIEEAERLAQLALNRPQPPQEPS